jgi:hypothetical protein
MALINKYSGSTLRFSSIVLKDSLGQPLLLSNFDNIFVEVSTNKANIVKFSLLPKDGYGTLTQVTANSFSFVVLSKQTILFNGECLMEIKVIKNNESVTLENNGIGLTSLGLNFVDNNIKNLK